MGHQTDWGSIEMQQPKRRSGRWLVLVCIGVWLSTQCLASAIDPGGDERRADGPAGEQIPFDQPVHELSFSPRGEELLIRFGARSWRAPAVRGEGRRLAVTLDTRHAAYSPDGTLLGLQAGREGRIVRLSRDGRSVIERFPVAGANLVGLELSIEGRTAATWRSDEMYFFNLARRDRPWSLSGQPGRRYWSVLFADGGNRAVVISASLRPKLPDLEQGPKHWVPDRVQTVDLRLRKFTGPTITMDDVIVAAVLGPGPHHLLVGRPERVSLIDLNSAGTLWDIAAADPLGSLLYLRKKELILYGSTNGRIHVLDRHGHRLQAHDIFPNSGVYALGTDGAEDLLAIGGDRGPIHIRTLKSLLR